LRDTRKDKGEGIDHWRTHERLRLEGKKNRESINNEDGDKV